MSPKRRLAETIYISTLAFWLASIVFSALFAAILFPTMKQLDPHIAGLPEGVQEHWRLAAGKIAGPIFELVGGLQRVFVAITFLALCLLWSCVLEIPPAARKLRSIAWIPLAATALATDFLVIRPMASHLAQFWTSVQANDLATAQHHRSVFDNLHHYSTTMLGATAALLVLTIAIAGFTLQTASPIQQDGARRP